MQIEFRPFQESDISTMQGWLKQSYVSRYWKEPECALGSGWWPGLGPGIYGIDPLIGDPSLVGKNSRALLMRYTV